MEAIENIRLTGKWIRLQSYNHLDGNNVHGVQGISFSVDMLRIAEL